MSIDDTGAIRLSTPPPDHEARYRRRARIGDALVVALWLSSAVAVALFLVSGGTARFGSVSDAVTSVGIMTGLVGTNLVLAMFILAARVPFIDRAVGHDRAIAVHRALGKPAFYLLLSHGVILLVGYGLASGLNPIAEIGPLLAIPDMPLAIVGMALLVVVVVTSFVSVRRRFSYETWHLTHLLSYAAVIASVPHQLSIGSVFSPFSFERAYWLALYVLAFGAILTHRLVEPLASSLRHRLRVGRIVTEAPGVVSIYLTGRRLRSLESAGGQFFIWRFWTLGTWWHSHPISLSAMATDTEMRITVRDLGGGSRSISAVRPGTRVWFEGPYGVFTDAGRTAPRLAIVVAGIGITPVRALLEDSTLRPGEATILLRASTLDDTFLWGEILQLAERKGVEVTTMIGPRARTGPGWMTQADADRGLTILGLFPDLLESDLYLCGPTPWLDLVEADARAAGIPDHQIHAERFDW
ncbi:ferredoxin reductase family protein [Lacisediminihabitans profunda]|uniref:Oxidoreductase n=1 Tax=Lacisediminihabitans profunda TaxID=2594790 RepID=A0A5C8UVT0_9MICO|nr:ferredoxin reductase family protein [Lacisediminihabitans profunda]TXN32804.1 oxidoreductase [Lacisediminihabitans profunda]